MNIDKKEKKSKGIFFTKDNEILEILTNDLLKDENIIKKNVFEPSCGNGDIILYLLKNLSKKYSYIDIKNFVKNNLFFNDILKENIYKTKQNIINFFKENLNIEIKFDELNGYCTDFTLKNNNKLLKLYSKIDYIIGNPPYVSLYGKQSVAKTEEYRKYILENYKQFPKNIKNGKINYIMLFIEHGMEFLKQNGKLIFIIDISFLDNPYKHLRKYIFENYKLEKFVFNVSNFKNVNSGQLIIKIKNTKLINSNYTIEFLDFKSKEKYTKNLNKTTDNKTFNINYNKIDKLELLIDDIEKNSTKIESYFSEKSKLIRTSTMLLNYEKDFVKEIKCCNNNDLLNKFLYYKGSKSLLNKFEELIPFGCYIYDIQKQQEINLKIKNELAKKGIKNKKRIGLGDINVFQNPKLYIRQSAKEIITSIDLKPSASNNSLYILSFGTNEAKDIKKLYFFNGWLNSKLITVYSLRKRIIKHGVGKQPQIRIKDLYLLPLIYNQNTIEYISRLSKEIYNIKNNKIEIIEEINDYIYKLFNISKKNINLIKNN